MILVLATVLLVVAVIGAAVAGPMLLSSFGGGETNAARMVKDDRLSDFLGQGTGRGGSPDAEEAAQLEEAARDSDRRIREAAANISRYVQSKQGYTPVVAAVTGYIQERADSLPPSLFDKYADSILKLSKDLGAAPRTAATVDVDQLIDWHFTQFARAAEEAQQRDAMRAMEEAERRGAAMAAGAAAVSFFMMFLLLVFVFVLVKIERNLRRLPVVVESAENRSPA
ncbi:hypothetical protein N0B44_33550 [Roseibacterium beibuensis]|uniref:hypothetical protein n=1 Tax=[Roseibacterium] beibuensis TaxID=1193142 RepID=UPI00217EF61A|nr:hypothetical protein [Roseibacterium beibuensis]MCS6627838.1 hypothetical protein [Roseibacterium beibuensis]